MFTAAECLHRLGFMMIDILLPSWKRTFAKFKVLSYGMVGFKILLKPPMGYFYFRYIVFHLSTWLPLFQIRPPACFVRRAFHKAL